MWGQVLLAGAPRFDSINTASKTILAGGKCLNTAEFGWFFFSRQPLQNRVPRVQVLLPLPKRTAPRLRCCSFFVCGRVRRKTNRFSRFRLGRNGGWLNRQGKTWHLAEAKVRGSESLSLCRQKISQWRSLFHICRKANISLFFGQNRGSSLRPLTKPKKYSTIIREQTFAL